MTCATLKAFKIDENVFDILKATEFSACFDVSAFITPGSTIKYYDAENCSGQIHTVDDSIEINPGWRVLVPTGYIFDVPIGFSLRAHPRSGNSLKSGVSLANCEGVIDADYTQQTFAVIINFSNVPFKITSGDRIIQIELVEEVETKVQYVSTEPEKKSSRDGGFGHTGTGVMTTTNVYADPTEPLSIRGVNSKRAPASVKAGTTSAGSLGILD